MNRRGWEAHQGSTLELRQVIPLPKACWNRAIFRLWSEHQRILDSHIVVLCVAVVIS